MKKETMHHYWDAKTKKHAGISKSMSCDISQGGIFVHQAFEIEIPECPKPLTDAEKLEKLVDLNTLYFEQNKAGASWANWRKTKNELKALIKEYSK